MMEPGHPVQALLEEMALDVEALCRLAGVPAPWLRERVTMGLLSTRASDSPDAWRFDAVDLRRARRMARLEHDFEAVPELAALVVDLEEELAALRARLQRLAVPER